MQYITQQEKTSRFTTNLYGSLMVEGNAHFDKLLLASLSSFTQKKSNYALNTMC